MVKPVGCGSGMVAMAAPMLPVTAVPAVTVVMLGLMTETAATAVSDV